MSNYYLAPSLVDLRNEINTANPNRDKTSDGWIGDASHAARVSDHNPDWSAGGVVRALDVDVDGCDPDHLIAVATKDPRVEYVISRSRIYERGNSFRPRVYTGANKHDKHTHVSLRHTKAAEKAGSWGFAAATPSPSPSPVQSGLSLADVAKQVIAGKFGNGDARATNLRNAGYDPAAVQAEVNRQLGGGSAPAQKSVAEIAKEVIAGEWGNGPQRSQRLASAGYNPTEIQNEVNRQLGANVGRAPTAPSVGLLASQVIAGQWGNGPDRAARLTAAGYDAAAVQAEVNRRLRR